MQDNINLNPQEHLENIKEKAGFLQRFDLKTIGIGAIAIALLGAVAAQFLPFWSISIVAALVAYLMKTSMGKSFFFGLLGGILLWAGMATYLSIANGGAMGNKVGMIFKGLSNANMLQVTGLIGGLLAGLGATVGSSLRDLIGK